MLGKRADPSAYPGSAGACTNEPKYLNFDYNNTDDKNKADSLHNNFCSNVGQLMVRGEHQVDDTDTTIFGRYFDAEDGEAPVIVSQVFEIMWNVDDNVAGTPLELTSTFIFDNEDFNGWCPETDSNDPSDGSGSDSSSEDGTQQGGTFILHRLNN